MQLRLKVVKVLLHIGMFTTLIVCVTRYLINYVGKDDLLKLGEARVFKILVDKLSSDPIQVVTCCLKIIHSQIV